MKLLTHTQKTIITVAIGISLLYFWLESYYIFFGALVFLICGLTILPFQRRFHYYWMKLAEIMGWIMNPVVLGLLFFLFITPLAIIQRVLNKNFISRKVDQKSAFKQVNKIFSVTDFLKPW